MKYEWCEAWVEELSEPPYVLLLLKERDGDFVAYDPTERRYPFRASNLQEMTDWLSEEEFDRLDGGRINIPRTD